MGLCMRMRINGQIVEIDNTMISVILVTFNSLGVLPKCIESLQQCSSAKDLDVIVIDNGSTDGTTAWLSALVESEELPFLNMRYRILKTNKGYAYANNRGIEMAIGRTILLLNPDTIVGRNAIQTCSEFIQTGREFGAVGCRLILGDGRLDKACRRSRPTLWNAFTRFSGLSAVFPRSRSLASYNLTYLGETECYTVDCISGAFFMTTRNVINKIGVLDEDFFMYGEDLDWCFRIKRAGYLIWYVGKETTIHLKGGNGGKRSIQSLRHFYDTMYLYYTKTLSHSRYSPGSILLCVVIKLMFYTHVIVRNRVTFRSQGTL